MKPETWQVIQEQYERFPDMKADGAAQAEIDAAAAQLGMPFPEDYQEFLRRYGSGLVGANEIAGLKQSKYCDRLLWNVVARTFHYRCFRHGPWPGTEKWVVFTDDGYGNPVGFDDLGRVWVSDGTFRQIVCLEACFEDFLRRWALHLEPASQQYLAEEK